MSVSVVIPTHDRAGKLRNLLLSIREEMKDKVESIVVVDDSKFMSNLEDFQDLNLDHVRINSRIFISRAKNIGWMRSKGDFVFFIDDDNIVGSSTILHIFDAIASDRSVGAVMPAVFYKSRPDLVWVYATPFLRGGPDMRLIGRNQSRNASIEGKLLETDALPNASIVRRTALEEVGGFDERLVVNSSLDFAQRLKAKGWKVLADTGASIYHDVEPPGQMGWWAVHGSVDPDRVRYELRDWFLIMKRLEPGAPLFRVRSTLRSLRFVVPNSFAYLIRGHSRRQLFRSVLKGYVEGLSLVG